MNVKLFDVFYRDCLRVPRFLVVELSATIATAISESGAIFYVALPPTKWQMIDLAEWERFADYMADDVTPKEMREYREHARRPFEWPKVWIEFKERYERTGNAFLGEPIPVRFDAWPNGKAL